NMLNILIEGRVYDLYDLYNWGKIGSIPGNLITADSTDFTSAYAAAEQAAVSALKETFESLK
nr:hypothetical protein [Clostridia bacterium]